MTLKESRSLTPDQRFYALAHQKSTTIVKVLLKPAVAVAYLRIPTGQKIVSQKSVYFYGGMRCYTRVWPLPGTAKPNPAPRTAIRSSIFRAPPASRLLAPQTAIQIYRAGFASAAIARPIPPQQPPRRQRQRQVPRRRRSPRPFRSQTALNDLAGAIDQLRCRQHFFGRLRPVFVFAGYILGLNHQTLWFAFSARSVRTLSSKTRAGENEGSVCLCCLP